MGNHNHILILALIVGVLWIIVFISFLFNYWAFERGDISFEEFTGSVASPGIIALIITAILVIFPEVSKVKIGA